jgi:hypothetical protein
LVPKTCSWIELRETRGLSRERRSLGPKATGSGGAPILHTGLRDELNQEIRAGGKTNLPTIRTYCFRSVPLPYEHASTELKIDKCVDNLLPLIRLRPSGQSLLRHIAGQSVVKAESGGCCINLSALSRWGRPEASRFGPKITEFAISWEAGEPMQIVQQQSHRFPP